MAPYNSGTENLYGSNFIPSFREEENNGDEIILKLNSLRRLWFGVHTSESDEGHWTKPMDRHSICRQIIATCKKTLKNKNAALILVGYFIESEVYLDGFNGVISDLTSLKNRRLDLFSDKTKLLSSEHISSIIAINRIAAHQAHLLQNKKPLSLDEIEICSAFMGEILELLPATKDGQGLDVFKELKLDNAPIENSSQTKTDSATTGETLISNENG